MPSRILREGLLTSDRMAQLNGEEERLYVRLLLTVDDFGLFDGRPMIVLAKAFPLKVSTISPEQVVAWLDALERVGLIQRYDVGGKPYLHLLNFGQRMRRLQPKYPLPPGMESSPLPLEENLREALAAAITSAGTFCGHEVQTVQQEVRLGASYMDIFVTCAAARFVLELKRTKLTDKSLEQVVDYAQRADAVPVLIGAGLMPSLDLEQAKKAGCAVVTYDDAFDFVLTLPARHVKAFDVVIDRVISRDLTRQNSRQETESYSDTESKTKAGVKKGQLPPLTPRPEFLGKEWDEFESHRRSIKKPLTELARSKAVKQLGEWALQGYDTVQIINDSIQNGWTGLFAKPQHKRKGPGGPSRSAIEEFLARPRPE